MYGSFNLGIHLIVLIAEEMTYKGFFKITSF